MNILKLELDDFGGLTDFKLELTPGINVFYGDNGAGKSTLALFIRTMLYGVGNDRKRDDVTMRMHIIPIGAQKASGRLIVEVGGRPLQIERSFGTTRKYDRVALTWLDDGSRLDLSKEPGEYLLDLTEDTFTRTFFVGEMLQAVQPDSSGDLTSRLMNLSLTGHENLDYHRAVKKLKEDTKALTNTRGKGRMDELLREKAALEAQLEEARQLRLALAEIDDKLKKDQARREELSRWAADLKAQADSLEELRELEDYEAAMLLLAKKTDLEGRIGKIRLPLDRAGLKDLRIKLEGYLTEEARLGQAVSRHNEAAAELMALEAQISPDYDRLFQPAHEKIVRELLAAKESLEERLGLLSRLGPEGLASLEEHAGRRHDSARRLQLLENPWSGVLPFGLGLLLSVYGLTIHNTGLVVAGVTAALGFVILLRLLSSKLRGSLAAQNEAQRQTLLELTGDSTDPVILRILTEDPAFSPRQARAAWEADYEKLTGRVAGLGLAIDDLGDYLKEQAHYLNQKELWAAKKGSVSENHSRLKAEQAALEALSSELSRILLPLELPLDRSALSGLERLEAQLDTKEREEAELAKTLNALRELSEERNLNPILLEPRKHREEGVRRELDLQRQIRADLDQHLEELAALDLAAVKTQSQRDALALRLGEAGTAKSRLADVAGVIEMARHRHQVLTLALENLEEAHRQVQRDYLPRVSKAVSETFRGLTQGRFDQVVVSGDFGMKLPLSGELSHMAYLSRGNLDLLWLGLRLALCAIIIRGEKAPLIFDDSFIHLDEDRLKNVLSYLSERIEGQIIILTCHRRETELLKEMDLL